MSNPIEASGTPALSERPTGMRFGIYLLIIVVLYLGDLVSGVWVLFHGLWLPTADVSLSSLLFWFGAWALCYLGYRRSKTIGIALVITTVVLTVLIVALVFFIALFVGLTSEA